MRSPERDPNLVRRIVERLRATGASSDDAAVAAARVLVARRRAERRRLPAPQAHR